VVLVREGGATAAGVGAHIEAGAAVVAAGVCAGWLVQPVIKTARRSRPIHAKYRTLILNKEFVWNNKHSGSTKIMERERNSSCIFSPPALRVPFSHRLFHQDLLADPILLHGI
jgi:hypothetical protein